MSNNLSRKEGAASEQCPEGTTSSFIFGSPNHPGNKACYQEAGKLVDDVVVWERDKTSEKLTKNLIKHMEKEGFRFLMIGEDGFYYEVEQDEEFFKVVRKIITDKHKYKLKKLTAMMKDSDDTMINNDRETSLPGIGGNDTPSEVSHVCNIIMNYYVISSNLKILTTYTSPITFYQGS